MGTPPGPPTDLAGAGVRRASALPAGASGAAGARAATHPLHGEHATWQEKNCYVDLWIELLHALGLEPMALWPHVVALDFEGDQFTFFKPPHAELRALYGIDVQELTVWRPLADHAIEHLSAGRPLSVEVDAFHLPDVAGTDYRTRHAKTTIVMVDIDRDARRLGYFHNAGRFTLQGEDYDALFATPPAGALPLPLFAEMVKLERRIRRPTRELQALALQHLETHLAWRPRHNPVRRFAQRLQHDLPRLREGGVERWHAYAFGTVRQLGAAFELAARGVAWHAPAATSPMAQAATAFEAISTHAKSLILKGARAVTSSRPTDLGPLLETLAQAWDDGMAALDTRPA